MKNPYVDKARKSRLKTLKERGGVIEEPLPIDQQIIIPPKLLVEGPKKRTKNLYQNRRTSPNHQVRGYD